MSKRVLLWLTVLLAACVSSVKPGLRVKVAPTGKVRGDLLITATFDRPMVQEQMVGKEVSSGPLRITPWVSGRLEWATPTTLTFQPNERLARSSRFSVEVPAGTRALDGLGLTRPQRFDLETERLEVVSLDLQGEVSTNQSWGRADQHAVIKFNQPVAGPEVERRCAYVSEKERIAAKEQERSVEATTTFVLKPGTPLAANTAWKFRCDAGLRGVEGDLGLTEPREYSFRTYGPLKLVGRDPDEAKIDPETRSLRISFSNPLSREGKLDVQVTPKRDGFPGGMYRSDQALVIYGDFVPATSYKVRIGPELRDVFGQKLGNPVELSFETGDARPGLSLETGQWIIEAQRPAFAVWGRNLTTLEVRAARVAEEKLRALMGELRWWDEDPADLEKLKIPSVKKAIAVSGERNRWGQIRIEPASLFGGKTPPTGFFYLALRAPEAVRQSGEAPTREVLLNFTDLGVVSKVSGTSGLVWVTRLSTGQPVAGAQVVARSRDGAIRWQGKTGADGVAITPGLGKMGGAPKARPAASEQEGDEGGDEPEGEGEEGPRGLLFFVRSGTDMTFVDARRPGGLSAYNFHVSTDFSPDPERLRGFLHTDRGLYRPGDTVHIKGLARIMRLGSGLAVPKPGKVKVVISDPRDNALLEKEVAISRFGGFTVDVSLPGDARLGDYSIRATLPQGDFRQSFSVEEYRPANFEVKGRAERPRYISGDRVKLGAEARYFYGAPVRGGTVLWRIHSRPRSSEIAGFPGYQFDDQRRWRGIYDSPGQELVTEERGQLDREGRASFGLKLAREEKDKPWDRDLLVEAQVQDETHQTISTHFSVPVKRASLYLGMSIPRGLVAAGKREKLRLVAVDSDGKRVQASARLTVEREDWSCAWEGTGYRGSYRCQEKRVKVLQQNVSIPAAAPLEVAFQPPRNGEYLVLLEGKDGQRRSVVSAEQVWVWGGDSEPAWRTSDSFAVGVVTDREKYEPGDTARLMLKAPLRKATGLLTIEREGILERRLFEYRSGQAVEVPLTDKHAPNVYASVMLFQGRTGPGSRGLPVLRMGLVNLPVQPKGKRLKVTIATDRPSYRPGEKVKASVQVADESGKPVVGEVSLAAADEGVLSLIAYRTPDPMGVFFAAWGLGVESATQLDRLLQVPEPNEKRSGTGGDSGKLGNMRSRFLGTAFWSPALVTDAKGRAEVSFDAPDNLTAFRLMAVVADAGDRFGSGELRFTVAKPLQLVSALPRFLSVGDEAQGAVVVHNETGRAGSAKVQAVVEGLELAGQPVQQVSVPVGGRVPVLFPLRARKEGRAVLRFALQMGGESDAFEINLPVIHPSAQEATVVAVGATHGEAPINVQLPPGTLRETAMVDLSVDPDGLAGVEEGLRELIEYPYGCLEQTTSRVIPLVMVEELARSLALGGLEGPALQRFLRIGIEKIGRHQTSEGGFSLWPGGQAESYLTAYALWGLHLAKQAGHPVDARRISEGIEYLRGSLSKESRTSPVHSELGEMSSRAFALHVLALLGKPETQSAIKLRESAKDMPVYGKAFLVRALAAGLGKKDASVRELLRDIIASVQRRAGYAMVDERDDDELRWYMSSKVRSTAIVLDTLLDLRPGSPLVPLLVRGLMRARPRGSWGDTQDNLYALVALGRYAKTAQQSGSEVAVRLGDRTLLEGALSGGGLRVRHLRVPYHELGGKPLRVHATRGKVHYSVRLHYRRGLEQQRARSAGFALRRQIVDPRSGRALDNVRVGEVVRVRLTMVAKEPRYHIALADRLPAGLEPINMKLVTAGGDIKGKKDKDDDTNEWDWRPAISQEMRDDRVHFFTEFLDEGVRVVEYLARATTAGKFHAPSASVEEMYHPDNNAATALRTFVVQPK